MTPMRPWREAATLLLTTGVGRAPKPTGPVKTPAFASVFDYKVLMLKRNSRSKFMPNAYVFPGGVVAKSDFSKDWLDLFKGCGVHRDELEVLVNPHGHRPMLMTKSDPEEAIHRDIVFRLNAIREAFEESGILLVRPEGVDDLGNSCRTAGRNSSVFSFPTREKQEEWMKKINKNPEMLLALYQEVGQVPDLWSLAEWSAWLTPIDLQEQGNRRFDTVFYTASLEHPPEIQIDQCEVTKVQWQDPGSILDLYYKRNIWLAPPQVYELCRLLNFDSQSSLTAFARKREVEHGNTTWLPCRLSCEDGFLSLLPGDSLYPERPNYLGDPSGINRTQVYPGHLNEAEKKSTRLHRIAFTDMYSSKPSANLIPPPHGHVLPLSFSEFQRVKFGVIEEDQCGACPENQRKFCHKNQSYDWDESFTDRNLVKLRNKKGKDKFDLGVANDFGVFYQDTKYPIEDDMSIVDASEDDMSST